MRLVVALLWLSACSGGSAPAPAPAEPTPAPAEPAPAPAEPPAGGKAVAAPGALVDAPWGEDYWIVVLSAAPGDADVAFEAAAERVTLLGVGKASVVAGLDCETGLSAADVGAEPDAVVVYARFDTEANATLFAGRLGGDPRVVRARNGCGG